MRIKLLFLFLIVSFSFSDEIKPAIVFDTDALAESPWNHTLYNGLIKFEKKTGIAVKILHIKPKDTVEVEKLANSGYNPIILSYTKYRKEIIEKIMKDHPNIRFIIINGHFNVPNAYYISFSYQEVSFLAGYLAMKKSKIKKIGFIGGPEIPLIKNFQCGYIKGAKYANKDGVVEQVYIGKDFHSFANPEKAYALALKQIKNDVDVIFSPSGESAIGALKAAYEKKILGIGIDSNQNNLFPGSVLTSAVTRVDNAIFRALMAARNNIWGSEEHVMGLQEKALELAYDKYNEKLISKELRKKLDQITADIILEKIPLENYNVKNECIFEDKKIF